MVSIRKYPDRLHRAPVTSIHRCALVLGRDCSLLVALPHLRLFSDVLACHIVTSVHLKWDADVLSSEALEDQLQQACKEMAQWKGRPFQSQPLPEPQRFSDPSNGGRGASSPGQPDVYGYFTNKDPSLHKNQNEFKGVIYACRSNMMKNTRFSFGRIQQCYTIIYRSGVVVIHIRIR